MKADVAKCPGCGADLPPELGKVTCQYCGKETLLRKTSQMQRPVVVVQTGGGRTNIAAILTVVGLTTVGIAVAIGVTVTRATEEITHSITGATGSESAASAAGDQIREAMEQALGQAGVAVPSQSGGPQLQSRICLLDDLNGDGANELSGFISVGGDRGKIPAILNGASGEILWQGQSLGADSHIHLLCVGPRWVAAVDNQEFELHLINAHDTNQQIRRALSDELDKYGTDDECLALLTDDRARLGFALEDGSERTCALRPRQRPHIEDSTTCGIISTLRRGANFELDDVTYNLTARRPGTPFLQASAKRGRTELWDVPLRLVPVSGEAIGCFIGVATPGVFMVFGAPRGNDHGLTVLGLNAEAGTERYSTDIAGTYGQINEIYYNGRFVVFGTLHRAIALDPATGQTAWQLGG